jgi:ABC-type branched-subunit amino acid transport system ATPase component
VTLLVLEGVDVSRGGTPVLHDVAIQVGERESICLLGRNGMGKTTLLRTVMGLTPSAAGRIAFDGAEIQRRRPHAIAAAGIGYVPQGRGIFSSLSVEDNLASDRAGERRPDRSSRSTTCFRSWPSGVASVAGRCPAASSSCSRSRGA